MALSSGEDVCAEIGRIDAALEALRRQAELLRTRRAALVAAAAAKAANRSLAGGLLACAPDDAQEQIFVHVGADQVAAAAQVCRTWSHATKRQSLWQKLFQRDFQAQDGTLLSLLAGGHVSVSSWQQLYSNTIALGKCRHASPRVMSIGVDSSSGPDGPPFAVATESLAIGPDDVPVHVGVGGDADEALLAMISVGAGVDHAEIGTGMAPMELVQTTSASAGVDRLDVATGMPDADATIRVASASCGTDRVDMASDTADMAAVVTVSKAVGVQCADRATRMQGDVIAPSTVVSTATCMVNQTGSVSVGNDADLALPAMATIGTCMHMAKTASVGSGADVALPFKISIGIGTEFVDASTEMLAF
eukprot:TRINITY_DN39692_c0_g1_i1.p1 TRINITY_DN39692_c0_g1~~TRINITY_DN39692_c0_g1_i1.p1  ORF type:complete len:363 (-),score=68.99 TRINITY_DN39692_c0_g1_i1:34-1122(-)